MKNKKFRFSAVMSAVFGLTLLVTAQFGGSAGCGSSAVRGATGGTGTGTGNIAGVTVNSVESTGDFTPGLSFYVAESGGLGIRANAVDVNGDGTASTPAIASVSVSSVGAALSALAADETLDCTDGEASSSTATAVGVGISLDTTASMGSTVGPIANGLAQLATDLSGAGFTGTFAGVTLGDAYATKSASGSAYGSTAQGTKGEPPAFDTIERPDTGTAPVSASVVSAFFEEVATVVGSGADGGDLPENYLAPLEFLNTDVTFAAGTQKVLISVGDDCAHTEETFAGFSDSSAWTPPAKADVFDTFAGAIVHVIGPSSPFCSGDYFDMKELTQDGTTEGHVGGTGGLFKSIDDCNTDEEITTCVNDFLAEINAAITGGIAEECDVTLEGDSTLVLIITLTGEGDTEAVATVSLTVTSK